MQKISDRIIQSYCVLQNRPQRGVSTMAPIGPSTRPPSREQEAADHQLFAEWGGDRDPDQHQRP